MGHSTPEHGESLAVPSVLKTPRGSSGKSQSRLAPCPATAVPQSSSRVAPIEREVFES